MACMAWRGRGVLTSSTSLRSSCKAFRLTQAQHTLKPLTSVERHVVRHSMASTPRLLVDLRLLKASTCRELSFRKASLLQSSTIMRHATQPCFHMTSVRSMGSWQAAEDDTLSAQVQHEAEQAGKDLPLMHRMMQDLIIEQDSLEHAVIAIVSASLADSALMPRASLEPVLRDATAQEGAMGTKLRADLSAVVDRDPAADGPLNCMLNFKGFKAIQAHRIANVLWHSGDRGDRKLAVWLQARASEVWSLDIHPAASIGGGLMIDHGTGVVIGETAAIGTDCSLLHGVTLGATGKDRGDRHPKLGNDILVGAGASIIGNIRIGDGCKIGASSVVLKPLPAGVTAIGAPAKIVGSSPIKRKSFRLDFADATDPCLLDVWSNVTANGVAKQKSKTHCYATFSVINSVFKERGLDEFVASTVYHSLDDRCEGTLTEQILRDRWDEAAATVPFVYKQRKELLDLVVQCMRKMQRERHRNDYSML